MQRLREHRIFMNRILRDERLTPNRALLAEMMMLWMDAEADEKAFVQGIINSVFGSPTRVRWRDEDDPPPTGQSGPLEKEAESQIREAFSFLRETVYGDTPSSNQGRAGVREAVDA